MVLLWPHLLPTPDEKAAEVGPGVVQLFQLASGGALLCFKWKAAYTDFRTSGPHLISRLLLDSKGLAGFLKIFWFQMTMDLENLYGRFLVGFWASNLMSSSVFTRTPISMGKYPDEDTKSKFSLCKWLGISVLTDYNFVLLTNESSSPRRLKSRSYIVHFLNNYPSSNGYSVWEK